MTREPQRRRRDIFTEFPAINHAGLIVRYPSGGHGRLSHAFANAAERLALTFRGDPADDAMLMPFLYLYRHAIELELKHAIQYAAMIRRADGEESPELVPDAVADRLQNKHRHRLMALVDELDVHLNGATSASCSAGGPRVAHANRGQRSFRYGTGMPESQDHIDFPGLAGALKGAYNIAVAASDILSAYEEFQQDRMAEARSMEADYAAEMRAEFEGW